MVFFKDPVPLASYGLHAAQLAPAMRERFAALAALWQRRGYELALGELVSPPVTRQ
jgi:hypothetical protein